MAEESPTADLPLELEWTIEQLSGCIFISLDEGKIRHGYTSIFADLPFLDFRIKRAKKKILHKYLLVQKHIGSVS
jgi:hypothetical protein